MRTALDLRRIADLVRLIAASPDADVALVTLVGAVASLDANACAVARLADPVAGGYRLAAAAGVERATVAAVAPFGTGLAHAVAEAGAPVLVDDVTADLRAAEADWAHAGVRTVYFGVPLAAGVERFGVLAAHFTPAERPGDDEWAVVEALAACTGLALARRPDQARAERELRARIDALERMGSRMSHELSNLVTIILGRAELIHEMLEPGARLRRDAGTIVETAERASALLQELMLWRHQEARDDGVVGAAAHPRGTETVLLVDDEQDVRETGQRLLEVHGYTVLTAEDGLAAVRAADRFAGPIHLLLTDVVMPRMNGRELGEVIGRRRPGIKVLYVSGYPNDVLGSSLAPGVRLLRKPFSASTLLHGVREALDVP
jgi:CheY-like chemotaxis protein